MIQLVWLKNPDVYGTGEICKVGKWTVGAYHYAEFRGKGDPNPYRATMKLPGIKKVIGDYETKRDAQTRVEVTVRYWFSKALGEPDA